jgi:hypothetical protein
VVHRKDHQLARVTQERVPLDGVETELNRFHQALLAARAQLASLKDKLIGKVPVDDARILDVHVAYLKDSVFISDVENLISNEQLRLEAAIAKVISDFDRIFRLVQNETLRERAVDLRDVGIRVLRQLEQLADAPVRGRRDAGRLRAGRARALDRRHVQPARRPRAGDPDRGGRPDQPCRRARALDAHPDADRGCVACSTRCAKATSSSSTPARAWCASTPTSGCASSTARRARCSRASREPGRAAWATVEPRTLDGEKVVVEALCGSLPEVEQAVAVGMSADGLYRTELLYLVDKEQPTRETLTRHYATGLVQARGAPVTFRLLQADSSLGLGWLHAAREPNPALGRAGVRALLAREEVLRRQIQALLRADVDKEARLLVPFVTDSASCGASRRSCSRSASSCASRARSTASAWRSASCSKRRLRCSACRISRRSAISWRSRSIRACSTCWQPTARTRSGRLVREPASVRAARAHRDVARSATSSGRPLSVFGYTATQPHNLPFCSDSVLRRFLVPPIGLREFLAEIGQIDARTARRATRQA